MALWRQSLVLLLLLLLALNRPFRRRSSVIRPRPLKIAPAVHLFLCPSVSSCYIFISAPPDRKSTVIAASATLLVAPHRGGEGLSDDGRASTFHRPQQASHKPRPIDSLPVPKSARRSLPPRTAVTTTTTQFSREKSRRNA
jgi:hypothetical protein